MVKTLSEKRTGSDGGFSRAGSRSQWRSTRSEMSLHHLRMVHGWPPTGPTMVDRCRARHAMRCAPGAASLAAAEIARGEPSKEPLNSLVIRWTAGRLPWRLTPVGALAKEICVGFGHARPSCNRPLSRVVPHRGLTRHDGGSPRDLRLTWSVGGRSPKHASRGSDNGRLRPLRLGWLGNRRP